jgi:hypothetical protein
MVGDNLLLQNFGRTSIAPERAQRGMSVSINVTARAR